MRDRDVTALQKKNLLGCIFSHTKKANTVGPITVQGSVRNSSVHSLLVTLGNHAVRGYRTYNWPCPVVHLPIYEVSFRPQWMMSRSGRGMEDEARMASRTAGWQPALRCVIKTRGWSLVLY